MTRLFDNAIINISGKCSPSLNEHAWQITKGQCHEDVFWVCFGRRNVFWKLHHHPTGDECGRGQRGGSAGRRALLESEPRRDDCGNEGAVRDRGLDSRKTASGGACDWRFGYCHGSPWTPAADRSPRVHGRGGRRRDLPVLGLYCELKTRNTTRSLRMQTCGIL